MIDKENLMVELMKVIDPELSLDIFSLGLIYDVKITDDNVSILMTLTSPGCPYGPAILEAVKMAGKEAGANNVEIEITFDPPWNPPEELKWALGAFSPWSA